MTRAETRGAVSLGASMPAIRVGERLRETRVLTALFFLGSAAVIALTFSPALLALWVLMWVFAGHYAGGRYSVGFLVFLIAYYLFYPATSAVFRAIHDPGIVLSGILVGFLIVFRPRVALLLKEAPGARFLFRGWIAWALIAYAPILFLRAFPELAPSDILGTSGGIVQLGRETTILKTAVPTVISVVAMLLPVYAFRRLEDVRQVRAAIVYGGLALTALSLLRYSLGVDFIPQEYGEVRFWGYRMSGFTEPDPNGFGRQLLLPMVYVYAWVISSSRRASQGDGLFLASCAVCVLLSFSRTTYVSVLASLVVVTAINGLGKRTASRAGMILLVVIAVGAVLKVGDYFAPGEDRVGLGHLVGRLRLYQAALAILRESPLFGAWPGGWQTALINLRLPGAQYGVSVHSMFLSVAVEWGIPMAFLLVLAVALSLRSGLRVVGRMRGGRGDASREMLRSTGCAVAACSVGLFVHGLTEIVPPYLVFLNLGIGVAIDRLARAETEGGALGRPGPHP